MDEKITVKQIFNLIDPNVESEEQVEIRPECDDCTWFSIPAMERDLLADDVLNRYVDSLSANDGKVCIWLSDDNA